MTVSLAGQPVVLQRSNYFEILPGVAKCTRRSAICFLKVRAPQIGMLHCSVCVDGTMQVQRLCTTVVWLGPSGTTRVWWCGGGGGLW